MKRVVVAILILLHGIGHAGVGVWSAELGPLVIINTLWVLAMMGLVSGALGMLRVPILRRQWKVALLVGTVCSVVLLVLYGGVIGVVGIPIDLVLVYAAIEGMGRQVDSAIDAAEVQRVALLPHPTWHRVGWTLGVATLVYMAAVALMRPMYLHWGTTASEREARLPGDGLVNEARYRVDHGITIRAPADSIWPWLVQLGQDRGGFYSYSSLERMFGDDIRNADRIHPEWQSLNVGDTIRATQADYFGGRFGTLGWKVTDIVEGRALVLENWGAFVLQPVDANTTRFIVRTRGEGKPTLAAFLFGPLNVFMFEPAHFIMQRGMLRGVRARAEAMVAEGS